MSRTTQVLDDGTEAYDGQQMDLDELRARLRHRAERRRQQLELPVAELAEIGSAPTVKQVLDTIERLRVVNPAAAMTAEYHYLARASLRSIALAIERSETECAVNLRMARAWLARSLKT